MIETMRTQGLRFPTGTTGRLLLFLALLAPPQVAWAATPCDALQTQLQMMECADADYKSADAALNAAYREVMAELRKYDETQPGWDLSAALKAAQRAWLPFRDRQCDWEAAFVKGGTMEPLIRLSCLSEMTSRRTGEIRETWKTYQ